MLLNYYGYSNKSITLFLEEEGFFVLPDGRTNYSQTSLVMASILNFRHIADLQNAIAGYPAKSALKYVTAHNLLFDFLRNEGYEIITFSTGLGVNEIITSDTLLRPVDLPSPFIDVVINNSVLSLFLWKVQYEWHINRVSYTLETLKSPIEEEKPIFVYAHVMAPHAPFIFGSNGEMSIPAKKFDYRDNDKFIETDSLENYMKGYKNQIAFIDQSIIEIVTNIRSNSPEAVIIIQGDHGPGALFTQESVRNEGLNEKFHILNAYYFPGGDYRSLSSDITPVNSFRLILNDLFGTNLPYQENSVFFSRFSTPLNLVEVTGRLNK